MGAPAHLFVLFGATGDLARRKLLPAVHRLTRDRSFTRSVVLGVARGADLGDAGYRRFAREALEKAGVGEPGDWCEACLHYQNLTEDADYGGLRRRIEELERAHELSGNRVFYLAVPPAAFAPIIERLGASGLQRSSGFTRLVVEKPFGRDLLSARKLNELVHRWFDESQVFRIDHFLGKETVQNLLVFRFANAMIEAVWNRDHVQHVQITVAEDIGIGSRGSYYDQVGALRDMIQNHVAQILTLVAMDVPIAYEAESIRSEKLKVLRALRTPRLESVVLGRYTEGRIGGRKVAGYLEEAHIPADSRTETYAALRLSVESWRWQGVPFFVRTGKRMSRALTEIAVTFKRPPTNLFGHDSFQPGSDTLVITLQPDEGFLLQCDVKRPGGPPALERISLDFRYSTRFGELPDAYVTLLEDIVQGDPTLFVHAREVERAWELCEPLLASPLPVREYAAGTAGPREADELLAREGYSWRPLA